MDLRNDKVAKDLGYTSYIPIRKSFVEMAYEFIRRGHVQDKIHKKESS